MVIPDHTNLQPVASLIHQFNDNTDQSHPPPRPRSPMKPIHTGQAEVNSDIAGEHATQVPAEQPSEKIATEKATVVPEPAENLNGNGTNHDLVPEIATSVEAQVVIEDTSADEKPLIVTDNSAVVPLATDATKAILENSGEQINQEQEPSVETQEIHTEEIKSEEIAAADAEVKAATTAKPDPKSSTTSKMAPKKVIKKPTTTTSRIVSIPKAPTKPTPSHVKKPSTGSSSGKSETITKPPISRVKSPNPKIASANTVGKPKSGTGTHNKTIPPTRAAPAHGRIPPTDKGKIESGDKSKPIPKNTNLRTASSKSATKPVTTKPPTTVSKVTTSTRNPIIRTVTKAPTTSKDIGRKEPPKDPKKRAPITKAPIRRSSEDKGNKVVKTKPKGSVASATSEESEESTKTDTKDVEVLGGAENEVKESKASHEEESIVDTEETQEHATEEIHQENDNDSVIEEKNEESHVSVDEIHEDVSATEIQEEVLVAESHEEHEEILTVVSQEGQKEYIVDSVEVHKELVVDSDETPKEALIDSDETPKEATIDSYEAREESIIESNEERPLVGGQETHEETLVHEL